MLLGRVVSTNVAVVRSGEWTGRMGRTGIDKRPVDGIDVNVSGACGDVVVDTDHHGGSYQAVYMYAAEDLAFWSTRLQRNFVPGNVGENLTVSGVDCQKLIMGQRLQIGTTILRVTKPRIPCRTFAGFWQEPNLVKDFIAAGRPGAYLAVEQSGRIRTDDNVIALTTPEHGVTIADMFAFKAQGQRQLARKLHDANADLPPSWVEKVAKVIKATLA